MNRVERLTAEIRSLEIVAHGKRIERCHALGDRDGAARYLREMNALIAARFAHMQVLEEQGGNYFALAGEMSRMQAEARRSA